VQEKEGEEKDRWAGFVGGRERDFSLFSNLDFTLTMEANKELGCGLAI